MDLSELNPQELIEAAEMIENPSIFAPTYVDTTLWKKQREIAHSVDTHPLTAVKACHSSGKTKVAAVLSLWWLMKHAPDAVVLTTAPTWHQVEHLLWGEIRSMIHWARKNRTFAWPEPNQTELKLSDKHYALGLSTNKGVRFQGFHSSNVLIIIDESPGVDPTILEAIEGIRAGGNVSMLKLGNPVIPAGDFYQIFHNPKEAARYAKFTISAFDTPNFRQFRNLQQLIEYAEAHGGNFDEIKAKYPAPYLTTPHWVWDVYQKWGILSPAWASRVEGRFPTQSDSAIYPADWIERAHRRCGLLDSYGQADGMALYAQGHEFYAGLDVAGAGSAETALCIRAGGHIVYLEAWQQPDPREEVINALMKYKGMFTRVTVDANGVGYYFALALADLGFPVVCANFYNRACEEARFKDQRAESYWLLREWLKADMVTGLYDPDTVSQLQQILYFENNGRVEIESKDDAKKRGVPSPDRAEAVILAFSDVIDYEDDGEIGTYEHEFQGVSRL